MQKEGSESRLLVAFRSRCSINREGDILYLWSGAAIIKTARFITFKLVAESVASFDDALLDLCHYLLKSLRRR